MAFKNNNSNIIGIIGRGISGDMDKIISDEIKLFLDSDMTEKLSEEKRLAFKQVQFNEKLLNEMIDKVIYGENKITIFIN